MSKDERYEVVRDMIETGRVTEFRHIFKYVPKTVMAHDLSTNTTRMSRMIERVEQFTIAEIHQISKLVEVDYHTIVGLVTNQYDRYLKSSV